MDFHEFMNLQRRSRPHGSAEPQKNGVASALSARSTPVPSRRSIKRAKPRDDVRATFLVVLGSALVMILALARAFGWEIFGGAW